MKHARRSLLVAIAPWVTSVLALGSVAGSAHETEPVQPATSPIGIAPHPSLPAIRPAPDFTLRDSADQPFALSQLRGRVVLLSFIYTSCTTTCPLLMQQMVQLEDRLKHAGLWGSSVGFVSVTVDPERDSAATLIDYAQHLGATDANWRFLRERPAQLQPVLAAYHEWAKRMPDGDIDHPARIYLIDGRRNIREIYALSFFDERQVLLDIQALLRESSAHSG
jgi:protein SCO1